MCARWVTLMRLLLDALDIALARLCIEQGEAQIARVDVYVTANSCLILTCVLGYVSGLQIKLYLAEAAISKVRAVSLDGVDVPTSAGADPLPYLAIHVDNRLPAGFRSKQLLLEFSGLAGGAEAMCSLKSGSSAVCSYVLNGNWVNDDFQCCARSDVSIQLNLPEDPWNGLL